MNLARRQPALRVTVCLVFVFVYLGWWNLLSGEWVLEALGHILNDALVHLLAIPIRLIGLVLILLDPVFRRAVLIPTFLGVMLAAYFRRQHKNGVLG